MIRYVLYTRILQKGTDEMAVEKGDLTGRKVLDDTGRQDICEIFCSDASKVSRLRKDVHRAKGLGSLFKAFADETRSAILYCLSKEELCVCDVALIMGMSVQAVSHHLRLLKASDIVRYRREGKIVYYSLDDDHIATLLQEGLAHVQHTRSPHP